MKKTGIISIAIVLLIVMSGIIFYRYTTTPKYSLLQIRKAFDQHDFTSFEKYVDIESITNSLIDQFLENYFDENSTKDKEEIISGYLSKGLIEVIKPKLNTIIKHQIVDIIETGTFEDQKKKENSKDIKTSFSDSLSKPDNVKNIFQGIEYEKKEGKICYVGIKFFNEKSKSTSILDLKMRDKGGYWQVVEILDVSEFTGSLDGLTYTLHQALNENSITKNDVKRDLDSAGNLKIETLDIESKFVTNLKTGKLFVITGRIKNGYSSSRRSVRIKGNLYTKGKILTKTQTVFCGNVLSDMELSNMEFLAIKKRLSNSLGDNKSNTGIKPGKELPFMIVFSELPDNLDEFAIQVEGSSPVGHNPQE
jgi:hypothetical protein